jgi:hypothetical protein
MACKTNNELRAYWRLVFFGFPGPLYNLKKAIPDTIAWQLAIWMPRQPKRSLE